ncbi:MAG TPA: hypothetical protein PLP29_18455 [Candidatus Ozemobacteraceae bacterium]|nr:hypothetical protein [Candidatus Ozemobacteraceae bacterium]
MAKAKTIKKPEAKPVEAPVRKKEKAAQGAPRDYEATETYEEGEVIYHKIWDDRGEVVEVGMTEDGIRKMKVHFDKVGLKNLRMGQTS